MLLSIIQIWRGIAFKASAPIVLRPYKIVCLPEKLPYRMVVTLRNRMIHKTSAILRTNKYLLPIVLNSKLFDEMLLYQ